MTEEAHFLTSIVSIVKFDLEYINDKFARLWTGKGDAFRESYSKMFAWHLPAEKRTGLDRMFNKIISNDSEVMDKISSCAMERVNLYRKEFFGKNLD